MAQAEGGRNWHALPCGSCETGSAGEEALGSSHLNFNPPPQHPLQAPLRLCSDPAPAQIQKKQRRAATQCPPPSALHPVPST
eukprot:1777505-Rhodomonas_salina.1